MLHVVGHLELTRERICFLFFVLRHSPERPTASRQRPRVGERSGSSVRTALAVPLSARIDLLRIALSYLHVFRKEKCPLLACLDKLGSLSGQV